MRAHRKPGNPWRSTIATIFRPLPRLVGPISAPPPLAIAKVASMKHSSSSSTPLSRSSFATSVRIPAAPRYDTNSESDDEPFYSSDSTAAASATAPRCSKSTKLLRELGEPVQACALHVRRESALPGNVPGCVPIARPSAESSHSYSGSTQNLNFEIGSSKYTILVWLWI